MNLLLWQLADSAFPTGGFSHSSGLEAAVQVGEVKGTAALVRFIDASLVQAGRGALPLCNAAFADPRRLVELDALCDAFLSNHVTNRASRVQGRTFVATCERVFGVVVPAERGHCHLAPLFGTVTRALGLPGDDMRRLWLFVALRGVLSAAVRLGVVGPYEAQRLQAQLSDRVRQLAAAGASLTEDDVAQTAPLLDLVAGLHDRLYSRLFLS